MSQIILVPTDFSKVCDNAMNHAAEIARHIKAQLVLLHVVNADSLSFLVKRKLDQKYIDQQLEETQIQLKNIFDLDVLTIKREGKISIVISKVSKEINADLIVMGTHGKTGMQKITGSHAVKLIHGVDIPVLVVQKRTIGMGYRKIVFPINVSTAYDIKIDWTLFIAKTFKSDILVFTMKTEHAQLKQSMDDLVYKITDIFKSHQINYQVCQAERESGFAHQIKEYAIENSADLIMIKVDNDEYEPSFIVGAQEESMIFNRSQIPVFCAQKK